MESRYNFNGFLGLSVVHKERIGQLISYLSMKIEHLYCTRLIKLLYIIDEESVINTGVPITWLKYKVYKMGPVPETLWFSIKDGNSIFGDYFDIIEEKNIDDELNYRISPIFQKEDLSEFSRKEVSIIDYVIDKFGSEISEKLIEYLHRKDSLWYQIVQSKKVSFENSNTTSYVIDLSALIRDDKTKLEIFNDAKEEINLLESLA